MASVIGSKRFTYLYKIAGATNCCRYFSVLQPQTIGGIPSPPIIESKIKRSQSFKVSSFIKGNNTIEQISSTNLQRYITTSCIKARKNDESSDSINDFRAREEEKESNFDKKDDEPTKEDESAHAERLIRGKILEASLQFVPAHGWTKKSLALGAEAVSYPSGAHGLFPGGGIELIHYFSGKCNDELLAYLKKQTNNWEQKVENTAEFIINATQFRLQMLEPYIPYWPQALAMMSMPQNVQTSLAQMLTLVDDIWYYSGDRSVDFKWYMRRIGLATIYKMTEVFLLQDSSPCHQETWRFLRNRMEEATYVQDILNQSEGVTQNMQKGLTSVFKTARAILGVDYDKR